MRIKLFSKKASIFAAAILTASLALTGCTSTAPSESPAVSQVEGPQLSGVYLVGKEAQEKFVEVAKASAAKANELGWTEESSEGKNISHIWYDPSAPAGQQIVTENGQGLLYRSDLGWIYPFTIEAFLNDANTITLENGTFTITSTDSDYKSVVETKDGFITKITTSGDGRGWDFISNIKYEISEASKKIMKSATPETEAPIAGTAVQ